MPLSPAARHRLLRAGCALHALGAAATLGGAVYNWRLRCEGFGCIGLGIAWAAWAGVLYAPTLLAGALLARLAPRPAPALLRHAQRALLVLGAGLAAAWAWHRH